MRDLAARVQLLALLAIAACGRSGAGAVSAGTGGLPTTIDSTADTVFARVQGEVAEASIRSLVEEVRIAPGAEDTTLFTDVLDFGVDRAERLWVYDRPTNSIFLFDAAGNLLRRVGRQGAGPGEFNWASGMVALSDTGFAIWDSQNARISFFTAAGAFRTSWSTPGGFSTSNGLVTDRTGALFLKRPVTAPREGEILGRLGLVRLKADGALGDSLAPPDLPIQRDVYVAVREDKTGRSSSSSSSQFAPGYFWNWHPEGFFIVGHGGNYEIVLARPGRKPLAIRREAASVPLQAEERAEEEARILWSMRRTDPKWSWTGPPVPERKAPLQNLFVSRDGRIWARVAVPSERIPAAELAEPRENRPPVAHFRTPTVYEVFEVDGHFVGRVSFPLRTRLIEADGNTVWALGRNEDDLPAVVRFRIEPAFR